MQVGSFKFVALRNSKLSFEFPFEKFFIFLIAVRTLNIISTLKKFLVHNKILYSV